MTYAERAAEISTQPENHEGENWDEVMGLCCKADAHITSLEDDILKFNDLCVAKTRKLVARIKELEA